MTERSYYLFIDDMLEAMDRIARYVDMLSFDAFECNEMVIDAVIRNLEIIGEAARSVPEDVRDSHPEVPWSKMIGLRNIIVHEYFGVDLGIIWEIVTRNLGETKPKIQAILDGID